MMKKVYTTPEIIITNYRLSEILANDNIISDPWGFEDLAEDEE